MKSRMIIFCLLVLASCQVEQVERFRLEDSPFRSLITNSLQQFHIDPQRDTVLVGARGMVVSVPANCFEGAKAGIPVTIEAMQVDRMDELLLLNLPTVSNGEQLQTAGVFYLDAKQEGQSLKVKSGQAISVDFPAAEIDPGMQAYVADFGDDGAVNWQLGNSLDFSTQDTVNAQLEHEFFSIPLKYFPRQEKYRKQYRISKKYPPEDGKFFEVPGSEFIIGADRAKFYRNIVRFLNDADNENSPLATREFARRLESIEWYFCFTYYTREEGFFYELVYDAFGPYQRKLFQIYLNNIDRPLWYADSLALQAIRNFQNIGTTGEYCKTTIDERYKRLESSFEEFLDERLTYPVQINDHGIDLSAPNAYADLLLMGVPKEEAQRTIELQARRQKIVESLRGRHVSSDEIDDQIEEREKIARLRYYFVKVNQLGWINIDRLFNAENAQAIELLADIQSPEPLTDIQTYVVFPGRNSFINGFETDLEGRYTFTRDFEPKTKLPVGEEVYILAISIQDEQLHLGKKKAVIADGVNVQIQLEAVEEEAFREALEVL